MYAAVVGSKDTDLVAAVRHCRNLPTTVIHILAFGYATVLWSACVEQRNAPPRLRVMAKST